MKRFFTTNALILFAALFQPLFGQALDLEWAINMGGDSTGNAICSVYDIAYDKEGNVFVAGRFNRTVDFDPGPDKASITRRWDGVNNTMDGFVAKFDAEGGLLWVKNIGSTAEESAHDVEVDTNGNVYVVGNLGQTSQQPYYFDTGTTAPTIPAGLTRYTDAFLAKYDTDGNFQWAKNFGGNGYDAGNALAVNQDGSAIYVGAMVSPNSAADTNGILLAKYDATGNETWRHHIIGDGLLSPAAIVLDSEENLVVTGYLAYASSVDFAPQSPGTGVVVPGLEAPFLAKYDSAGALIWVQGMLQLTQYGSSGHGADVAVDKDDNILLVGFHNGTLNFDSTNSVSVTTNGANDGFIAKYNPAGNCLWANGYGSTSLEGANGVYTDRVGNVYMSGSFRGTVDFDPGSGTEIFTAQGGVEGVWVKFTADGDFIQAGNVGGEWDDIASSIVVDQSGNVFVGGSFRSAPLSIHPGADTLHAIGLEDAFILKFSCNDTTSSLIEIAECSDEYSLNDVVYNQSGVYHQIYPNVSGCDSTIILDLTLHSVEEPIITINVDTLSTVQRYATYQWVKNGALISGATDETYVVSENADYQVIISSEFGCTDTSEVYQVTNQDGSSIHDSDLKRQVKLYPNPTSGLITLSAPLGLKNAGLRLMTLTGKVLTSAENLDGTTIQFNLSSYPSGIYFIELYQGAEAARFKVVKY